MEGIEYSLVVPVYKNRESLPRLLSAIASVAGGFDHKLEVVFVVDGSPDDSFSYLQQHLPHASFSSQLIGHSRNFGAFTAIRNGIKKSRGDYACVMAADLQEPIELAVNIFSALKTDQCDVAVGKRTSRKDPFLSKMSSEVFWWLYRKLVVPEIPKGGVDVFGCNKIFKRHLLELEEARSSLVALIFWLGFRRCEIDYERQSRQEGKSAWTLRKKLAYLADAVCAFTDLPIRVLTWLGGLGIAISLLLSIAVLSSKFLGRIDVPGYAATIVFAAFIGSVNLFSTGIVGIYAWRGYENTKQRPLGVIASAETFSVRQETNS